MNKDHRALKVLLIAFIGFFGYTMVTISNSKDSYRHRMKFEQMAENQDLSFSELLGSLYAKRGEPDVVMPVIRYAVSRHSDNSNVYYLALALFFGFFYVSNFLFVFKRIKDKFSFESIIYLLMVAFIIAPWEINSFRFWTGAHALIYGVLRFTESGNKKYLWIVLLAPFAHFGLFIISVITFIFCYLDFKFSSLKILFIISLFVTEISLEPLQQVFNLIDTPIAVQNKASNYLTETYRTNKNAGSEGLNWYVRSHFVVMRYAVYALILYLFYGIKRVNTKSLNRILALGIFLIAISNIVYSIPAIGSRTIRIGVFLLFAAIAIYTHQHRRGFIPRQYRAVPMLCLLFYLIVTIRVGFDYINVQLLTSNFLLSVIAESKVALIQLIK